MFKEDESILVINKYIKGSQLILESIVGKCPNAENEINEVLRRIIDASLEIDGIINGMSEQRLHRASGGFGE